MSKKPRKFKEKFQKYEDKPNVESDFPIKLSMWYFDQCDPKKCSGMILKKYGLLSTLSKSAKFNGIVLTPTAQKVVSEEDHELIEKCGVCVIDCSWQFFNTVKVKSIKANERLLPLLLAANPVNYGKEIKLTCAEALAGALLLSGFQEEAERLMDCFKWGPAFFSINELHFEKYLQCKTSDEMLKAQEELIQELKQMKEENRNRQIDLPPTSSDEEEEEEEKQEDDEDDDKQEEEEEKKEYSDNQDEEERKQQDDKDLYENEEIEQIQQKMENIELNKDEILS